MYLDAVRALLLDIEHGSGKGSRKWAISNDDKHLTYMERVLSEPLLKGGLYYGEHRNTIEYRTATLSTVVAALALHPPEDGKPHILIDGLKDAERQGLMVDFRRCGVHPDKVIETDDKKDPLARLADALAGFARDGIQWHKAMKPLLDRSLKNGLIRKV